MKHIFYALCELLYKESYSLFEFERFRIETHIKQGLYYSDTEQTELN
jgi:hypothetical protein